MTVETELSRIVNKNMEKVTQPRQWHSHYNDGKIFLIKKKPVTALISISLKYRKLSIFQPTIYLSFMFKKSRLFEIRVKSV